MIDTKPNAAGESPRYFTIARIASDHRVPFATIERLILMRDIRPAFRLNDVAHYDMDALTMIECGLLDEGDVTLRITKNKATVVVHAE